MKRIIVIILLLSIGLFFLFWLQREKQDQYQIMSYEQYGKINHVTPYVYKLVSPLQELLYFGARHSYDIHDDQWLILEKYWREFLLKTEAKNGVVLIEGKGHFKIESTKDATIEICGEPGFITFLANKANIKVESAEPNPEYFMKKLLKSFTQEQIAYKIFAQAIVAFDRLPDDKKKELNVYEVLESVFNKEQYLFSISLNMDLIEKVYNQFFKKPLNLNDAEFFKAIAKPRYTEIFDHETFVNKICRTANIFRDQYVIQTINKYLQEGKNIFIVFGSSHAVMQEPAIRTLWKKIVLK